MSGYGPTYCLFSDVLNRWGKYPLQSSFKSKHPGNLDNRIPKKLRESRKVKSSSLATCMYMILDPYELCKGYFPHLFNTSENKQYVGPYPDIFGKSPIGMVPSEGYTARDNFSMSSMQWLKWTMAK
jgi:hypothetical protein